MTLENHQPTPKIQYPLRLEHDFYNRFQDISKRTRIPMSTLGRLGISKFIEEIESKGITKVLSELESE